MMILTTMMILTMMILWWFYDDLMMILWWSYDDLMMILWWFYDDLMINGENITARSAPFIAGCIFLQYLQTGLAKVTLRSFHILPPNLNVFLNYVSKCYLSNSIFISHWQMVVNVGWQGCGFRFSCRNNSSFRLNGLCSLCLWQYGLPSHNFTQSSERSKILPTNTTV